ncbi:MAG: CRISPR-associated protein, partial [Proteobacteria bacterium]
MRKDIKYKITFLDYWHLSSGLSGGARFDSSVLKDENSLPFVSGKTIKGLLRIEAEDENFINKCFGVNVEKGDEKTQNQQG